jgi:predicted Fe-Mo cluster-binding NifX family protein
MKTAIPIWDGKISPVFDTASKLLIIQVEDKKETSRFEAHLDDQNLSRRCSRIQDLGIDVLICGAISRPFYRMLVAGGVNVIPWISGPAEDVLDAWMNGTLLDSRFLMPGCNWQKKEKAERFFGKSMSQNLEKYL